jgi:3-phosphoshikimate 1-carboxyvinyltransferase
MGSLRLTPEVLKGRVEIPPSKSMAHRAIICAALSDGKSKISNIHYSDDMIATIEGMRAFGAEIIKYKDHLEVKGIFSRMEEINLDRVIDCNESGSTLRFLLPIALLFDGRSRFVGRGNLGKRPLNIYYEIFKQQGIKYKHEDGILDLVVEGKLTSGEFKLQGNVSSQFITGLLFILPMLCGDSKIIITTELESRSYIDLTLSVLESFGIKIINKNYKEFYIKGDQKYQARDYRVEGDYSQAAFYLVANAIGGNIQLLDLNLNSLQGDKKAIEILESMGASLKVEDNYIGCEVNNGLKATVIDGSQCPDIIPVMAVAAALAEGTTEIINIGRLRIKECDRISAMHQVLNSLGVEVIERESELIIKGRKELLGGVELWSHKDHRIAMAIAIASTRCTEAIILKDWECVTKSYPKFFEDFKMLGGKCHEWNMGK